MCQAYVERATLPECKVDNVQGARSQGGTRQTLHKGACEMLDMQPGEAREVPVREVSMPQGWASSTRVTKRLSPMYGLQFVSMNVLVNFGVLFGIPKLIFCIFMVKEN